LQAPAGPPDSTIEVISADAAWLGETADIRLSTASASNTGIRRTANHRPARLGCKAIPATERPHSTPTMKKIVNRTGENNKWGTHRFLSFPAQSAQFSASCEFCATAARRSRHLAMLRGTAYGPRFAAFAFADPILRGDDNVQRVEHGSDYAVQGRQGRFRRF
jgi:hypothetical protein